MPTTKTYAYLSALLLALPLAASAQTSSGACDIVGKLTAAFINPALALIFSAGLLVFIYGLTEFIWGLSQETGKKEEGKKHMLWGLIGMFVMVSAIAIIKILANIVGGSLPCGS
jgi:hypothetical protein